MSVFKTGLYYNAFKEKFFKYSATDRVISLAKSELYLRLQKARIHSV